MAAARLAAAKEEVARRIVAHAGSTVPCYRDATPDAGLRPEGKAGTGDLALLPLVTGERLAVEPER